MKKTQKKKEKKSHDDSDESDILEGLSERKKEKIISEIAEIYKVNVALEAENKLLKKQRKQLAKGIKFLDIKDGAIDSMNYDTEGEGYEEESFVKNGSYTDNDDLGKSHYDNTIGSIHNIYADPTDPEYIKSRKMEKEKMKKPEIIPVLDFKKLENNDLIPMLKVKAFGKKVLKGTQSGKIPHYSLSNRTANEKISFTMEGEGDDQTSEAMEGISNKLKVEEKKNDETEHGHSNIMIKDLHNVSTNLLDDSQNYWSNISKLQNSCDATSSEATKKYDKIDKVSNIKSNV